MLASMAEPFDPVLEARIDDDPDDDARFHAYAEWLVAQGSPRGELAKVQLARAREGSPELAAREAALIEAHGALLRGVYKTRYSRWLDDFCIVRWHAGFWRRIEFSGTAEQLRLVLAHRSARLVNVLQIRNSEVYDPAITAVAAAGPQLGALRELRIGEMPEGQDAMVGFGDRTCTNLGELARGCSSLTTLRLLCPTFELGTQPFPSLRWLDARTGASPASLAALARARLPRLERLDLAFDTSAEEDAMWPSLCWPDDALDGLLAAVDVAMPALARLRLWPMPYAPDHPLLERLVGTPRIEVGNWDDMAENDDADGTYEL
jgi:uncharacterized protein (TIGR02996 family)